MLAITGRPNVDLRQGQTRGARLPVSWVKIDNPDPPLDAGRRPEQHLQSGLGEGRAKFNRLEGCWEDDSTIFFVSTSGGDAKNGDIGLGRLQGGLGQVSA